MRPVSGRFTSRVAGGAAGGCPSQKSRKPAWRPAAIPPPSPWWRYRRPSRPTRSRPSSAPASACSARIGCRKPRPSGLPSRRGFADIDLHLIGPLQSQQSQGGGGAVRRHPCGRPAEPVRGARQGDREAGPGIRSCSWRSTPRWSRRSRDHFRGRRCLPARMPRDLWARDPGADVHTPARRAPCPSISPSTAKIAARNGLTLLSMGMSADYETAIRFGATHVRVGSAIFRGARLSRGAKPGRPILRDPRHASRR